MIPVKGSNLSLHHRTETDPEFHRASYPVVVGCRGSGRYVNLTTHHLDHEANVWSFTSTLLYAFVEWCLDAGTVLP
jgi:hypothetical protein